MAYGQTDEEMNAQISPVFYRTSSPLGLLPKKADSGLTKADSGLKKAYSDLQEAGSILPHAYSILLSYQRLTQASHQLA